MQNVQNAVVWGYLGSYSGSLEQAQAWSSLPTNVTASTSLPSFKRQLKTFFIYQIFPITLNCSLIFVYRVLEAILSLCHVNQYVLLLLILLLLHWT